MSTPRTPRTPADWVEAPQVAAITDAAMAHLPPAPPSRVWERGPIRVISSFMPENNAWLVSVSRYGRCPKDPRVVALVREEFGMERALVLAETDRQVSLCLVAQ